MITALIVGIAKGLADVGGAPGRDDTTTHTNIQGPPSSAPSEPRTYLVPRRSEPVRYFYRGSYLPPDQDYDVQVDGYDCGPVRTDREGEFDMDITPCVVTTADSTVEARLMSKGSIVDKTSLDIDLLETAQSHVAGP
ncbi:hypothetical protein KOI35_03475 [Actinoplanes bogorensis]|uniref:Uncharacterized protein n=1 Tax=Paractinoplanes bogorensis TaxID=1610840 RepID=A0ABS5YGS9_9ACTN|nr:hypothetical protein [Actinoplanes bogorensis]MBU2662557.1 hypothetical protein [Actinoplanes bogorensis]